MLSTPALSVVIPVLNEARCIGATLETIIQHAETCEIIVVDGGSTDDTCTIVSEYPEVRLLQAGMRGRAAQMNAGADAAHGKYLLFLHADTHPPVEFDTLIDACLNQPGVVAGGFGLTFDTRHWLLDVIARVTQMNFPWLTFGDHGMFVCKRTFEEVGGYAHLPILEDLDLQRRLRKRGRLARPPATVRTSARRFVNNGVVRQTARNVAILMGYFIGISPERLARWYPQTASAAR